MNKKTLPGEVGQKKYFSNNQAKIWEILIQSNQRK